jgi:predicted phage gp36 major capsid-like protein
MQTEPHRLETKSADSAAAIEEFNRAFEAYKEENEAKLAEIKSKLGADVLTTEKLARIDATLDSQKRILDRINLERARPRLGGERSDHLGHEHRRRSAFTCAPAKRLG